MIANLSWTANSEGDLLKYKVYASRADGIWTGTPLVTTQEVTAPATSVQITGLPDGATIYFAVTAIDNALNESSKSSSANKINKYTSFKTS